MADNTALANRPPAQESALERVKNYMLSPEVKERFSEMMGANGIYYLNQVMILVANSEDLQKCSPKSILISAMRAASLRLSVDPGQGQAWIIPYKGVATFQLGYKGVYELALRTNLYRHINVIDIYEGETLEEDRLTGMHSLKGAPTSKKVVARMLYFELTNGFKKTFVMTVDEIDKHAEHYAQGYHNPRSKWNDPIERPKMERKTVLSNGLRKWGRFNPEDENLINEIEDQQGFISRAGELPEESEVSAPAQPSKEELIAGYVALGQSPEEAAKLADQTIARRNQPSAPIEADPQTGEIKPTAPAPVPAPAAEVLPALRYSPEALKARLVEAAAKQSGPANGKRGLVVVLLETILSQNTDPSAARHQLLKFLTGAASSKDIPDNMILALFKWLSPTQDAGGEWIADPMSAREAIAAFNACQPPQEGLF